MTLDQIKQCIQEAITKDLKDGIEQFREGMKENSQIYNVITLQLGRVESLQKEIDLGTITRDEADVHRNRIRNAVLNHLKEIEDKNDFKPGVCKDFSKIQQRKKIFGFSISIIITITIMSIIIGVFVMKSQNLSQEVKEERNDPENKGSEIDSTTTLTNNKTGVPTPGNPPVISQKEEDSKPPNGSVKITPPEPEVAYTLKTDQKQNPCYVNHEIKFSSTPVPIEDFKLDLGNGEIIDRQWSYSYSNPGRYTVKLLDDKGGELSTTEVFVTYSWNQIKSVLNEIVYASFIEDGDALEKAEKKFIGMFSEKARITIKDAENKESTVSSKIGPDKFVSDLILKAASQQRADCCIAGNEWIRPDRTTGKIESMSVYMNL